MEIHSEKKPSGLEEDPSFSKSTPINELLSHYYHAASSMPNLCNHTGYQQVNIEDNNTDDDAEPRDLDFVGGQPYGNRAVRTGRQRKKLAARSKGGEFQTKRRKRRVYFCCISSEIDVQKLVDHLNEAQDLLYDWRYELQNDVLHMYKPGSDDPVFDHLNVHGEIDNVAVTDITPAFQQRALRMHDNIPLNSRRLSDLNDGMMNARLVASGSKEVFVFDFGAIVFWGFLRGEEVGLLKTIRMFATKGVVGSEEFSSGEDDMAFVISPEGKTIAVANDVITLPDSTVPKQRLAVSFAIAQSSVLSIFESRIEQKVEEYKYIPEVLAANGKVHLSQQQLGMMIGEVFVIRHDVNLHTEILEETHEVHYKMVSSYLEMSGRTEILNKCLDMLRELLDVLQQQMENDHAVKLEWIVIYLIIAEVVLQGLSIAAGFMY